MAPFPACVTGPAYYGMPQYLRRGCLPGKYYGMRRTEGGEGKGVIMGCRCSPGAGWREAAAPVRIPGGARWDGRTDGRTHTPTPPPRSFLAVSPSHPPRGPLAPVLPPPRLRWLSAVITNKAGQGILGWLLHGVGMGGGCYGAFPVGGYYGMESPL